MDKFLIHNSWFDEKYQIKSDGRYITFKITLNLFKQRGGKIIVETGTTRLANDWGAGMSTLLFADFLKTEIPEGYLSTVDIEENNIRTCKRITEEYRERIEYAVQDSVEFLKEFPFSIDLLYLDSLDYPYGEMLNDYGGQEDIQKAIERLKQVPEQEVEEKYRDLILPAQQHQLREYMAIKNKLSDKALILLDDNDFPGGGKCRLTKQQLFEDGWELIIDRQQALFQRA